MYTYLRGTVAALIVCGCSLSSCTEVTFDVQAHRGGAGLMPENTIEAMIHAVDLGVTTLELDVVLTKDKQVVLSHNHYIDPAFVQYADGTAIGIEDTLLIKDFPYVALNRFDLGSKTYPKFPDQKKMTCAYSLLSEMIQTVENYCDQNKLERVNYNIEVKSWPSFDGRRSFDYKTYSDEVVKIIQSMELGDRVNVQSFDVRCLEYLHQKYDGMKLSYLVDDTDESFDQIMAHLSFTPEYISPHHHLINENFLKKSQELGMVVVPWTVDEKPLIRKLLKQGVSGIISNYPDRVIEVISE